MTDYCIASVAVENTSYHFDKLYDYIIPKELEENTEAGCRIMISFGRGSLRQGMIMSIRRSENIEGLKTVNSVLDKKPVLSSELLKLAADMKERYYCTLFEACNAMLPPGLSVKVMYKYKAADCSDENIDGLSEIEKQITAYLKSRKTFVRQDRIMKNLGLSEDNISILSRLAKKGILLRTEDSKKRLKDITVKMVRISNYNFSGGRLSPRQKEILDIINSAGSVSRKEICYFTGCSASVVDTLVKKGICEYFDEEPYVNEKSPEPVAGMQEISLTPQQKKAYDALTEKYESQKPSVSLLYGVTGSGKTSVFMKLIDRATEDNRGVICMVPEIALTPQLLEKFNARYGERVAVFHSGLSLSKRLEEWKRVKSGEATIAVGTRSAIFAPLENIGLIVIDEEQEYTYKASSTPRFHARELAKLRCGYNNCMLLLSSATPSVESFYLAKQNRYSLVALTSRYGNAKLPHVITADMNIEIQQGNSSGYSSILLDAIEDNLEHGNQSIILLNRRGHNTFVSCRKCREVISCPNCSISLTYHSANNRMMCHYCGYSMPAPTECPYCRSDSIRYSGTGTQKAENELYDIFPSARILRLDTDSTMRRFSYEKKLSAFQNGEYDIMLGTQMVAKGLDFPNVTLVGVLSADNMLHNNDFRSYERTFSLLTQVVGRSGRGGLEGRAIIQTYEPENRIIELAASQDYNEFFETEIKLRRSMLYPPFSDICVVVFIGAEQKRVREACEYFTQRLKLIASEQYGDLPMRVLKPSAAMIPRINNKFRYRLIIKFKNTGRFREMMSTLLCDFGASGGFSDVSAYADVNPDNII